VPDQASGVHVIATTISGSVRDWAKVERIVPLFRERGRDDVTLDAVDSHAAARDRTRDVVRAGCRRVISAGGSGTFNAVLEGCIDAGVPLESVALGFLRKGSADLIGKVLRMPDDVEAAVDVFVAALAASTTVPCDVIQVESQGGPPPRHFVGYGGAGIFGRIPHFTENRAIRYYKGILGQLFGDLGPFAVGAALAALERAVRVGDRRRSWTIAVDGERRSEGRFQALVLVNGDLGPNLPWAAGVPLGSGDFHLFGLRDIGAFRLPGQFRRALDGSITEAPERWGFEHHRIQGVLEIARSGGRPFPVNVDGSTFPCPEAARFRIAGQVRLMARPDGGSATAAPERGGGPGAPA
jgi:diacylglycerol kinase family enzyme